MEMLGTSSMRNTGTPFASKQLSFTTISYVPFISYSISAQITNITTHAPQLLLSDPAAIKHIFTTHTYSYTKSPVFRPLIDRLLGKGLVWAEGEALHRRMRNLTNPVFSAENVRGVQDDIIGIAERLKVLLEAHVHHVEEENFGGNLKEKKVVIDAMEWSGKATMDVIGKVGFAHDLGATDVEIPEEKKKDANEIAMLWLEQVNLGMVDAGFIVRPLSFWILIHFLTFGLCDDRQGLC
jgi:hypothetical protein